MPTHEEMITRARTLLPALRARSAEAEKNRRLPDETIAEFRTAGFHRILQPRRFGGYELGIGTAAECIRTLATACGSSGWIANLFVVHNYQLSLFPEAAQREYWAGTDDVVCRTGRGSISNRHRQKIQKGPRGPFCIFWWGGGNHINYITTCFIYH